MQTDLLARGVELALIGMGTVFVFLTMLVLATLLMSWLIQRFSPVTVAQPVVVGRKAADDGELIAVIGAAIRHHREHGRARRDDP